MPIEEVACRRRLTIVPTRLLKCRLKRTVDVRGEVIFRYSIGFDPTYYIERSSSIPVLHNSSSAY